MIEQIFYYGTWIFPPIIILLFAYKKNPKVFLIAILSSIFISFSCYVNVISPNQFLLKSNFMESHRHLVIIDIQLIGGLIIICYSLLLSWLIWNFLVKKTKNLGFKEFMNGSSFYFILFFGSVIDIGIDILEITYWHSMMLSFFLFSPFLIKALIIKYSSTKIEKQLKTSSSTWILLLIVIIFYLIIWF